MARELELDAEGVGKRGSCEQKPEQERKEDAGHDDEHDNRAYNDYRTNNERNQNYHQHGNIIA